MSSKLAVVGSNVAQKLLGGFATRRRDPQSHDSAWTAFATTRMVSVRAADGGLVSSRRGRRWHFRGA